MPKRRNLAFLIMCSVFLSSCSPRDFLTRRLASDLIAGSNAFRAPQQFQLRTGVLSNDDYLSQEYLALQHHGWLSATKAPCPPALLPPPCWDLALTPAGVDTFQDLIPPGDADKQSFTIPAARRELIAVAGIAKQGNLADVEFTWKWNPSNEVGAVLYPADILYRSTVAFRDYDDGWRLTQSSSRSGQTIDEALKNAEPAQ
jgi:hypothetical protein